MNAYIYNKNFEKIQYIDGTYESFIWTDRYNSPGDFELVIPLESNYKEALVIDNYIELAEGLSDRTMIIESVQIEASVEDGKHIKVTGRSLESLLDRRIIWKKREYKKDNKVLLKTIIQDLFNDNISNNGGNPNEGKDSGDKAKRKMPITLNTTFPTKIANYKIYDDTEYYDTTYLDVIEGMCKDRHYNMGFKVLRDKTKNGANFILSFYVGRDLSYYNPDGNKTVYFSPNYDNLLSSTYLESKSNFKNFTRITNGSGDDAVVAYFPNNNTDILSGIERRETTSSANIGSEETVTVALLQTKGREDLRKKQITKTFEGEILDKVFYYQKDYFIGDIVQYENEFGDKDRSRIIEYILSSEIDGHTQYPTLESTRDDEDTYVWRKYSFTSGTGSPPSTGYYRNTSTGKWYYNAAEIVVNTVSSWPICDYSIIYKYYYNGTELRMVDFAS